MLVILSAFFFFNKYGNINDIINNYLKKCYPNLTYNESYQQFVQDFVKDEVKKGFYTIAYEDKINNNLLKNTSIFIKIKDANKNYSNPFPIHIITPDRM